MPSSLLTNIILFFYSFSQGYVTELLLTLEAVVSSLDSNIRPLDLSKEIFKSTPNLKDASSAAGIFASVKDSNKRFVNNNTS